MAPPIAIDPLRECWGSEHTSRKPRRSVAAQPAKGRGYASLAGVSLSQRLMHHRAKKKKQNEKKRRSNRMSSNGRNNLFFHWGCPFFPNGYFPQSALRKRCDAAFAARLFSLGPICQSQKAGALKAACTAGSCTLAIGLLAFGFFIFSISRPTPPALLSSRNPRKNGRPNLPSDVHSGHLMWQRDGARRAVPFTNLVRAVIDAPCR